MSATDNSDERVEQAQDTDRTVDRRAFMRSALATAALATVPSSLTAQGGAPGAGGRGQAEAPPPRPLGNGEPPAMVFQPYPGGTGAYLEKIARERGRDAFERERFTVEGWRGPVPTSEDEIAYLPAHRLAALIQSKKITSVQLTEIYLNRMKRLDPQLLCAVSILEGPAREAAQQADAEIRAGKYRGPLHGIPYGIKDLFAVRGTKTTWGSKAHQDQVIDVDSEVYIRLRDAGAVLIAKLATGLFAQGDNWYRGQTKNPWNLSQGSSGSSAGPGSATAAGCVAFGIGTETQGSIVSPTMRNGLSALRPTFGRVSRYGGMVLAWSMDKVGPICRTVEDAAMVFNTIHGADEKDPATVTAPFHFDRKIDLSKVRIGYDVGTGSANNPGAPQAVVDKLRELGARPIPMPLRPNSQGISGLGVESAAAFDSYIATLPPQYVDSVLAATGRRGGGAPGAATPGGTTPGAATPDTAGRRGGGGGRGPGGDDSPGSAVTRFARGRTTPAIDFMQAQRRRYILIHEMAAVMKDFDMYISGSGDVGLTNQTGHPAVVFPYRMSEGANSQPQCTTIIGALFADDVILSVAHAYQKSTNWHEQHPKL
jgi:Asp-tRNA(Asn)/Glu-tRNA(Gln) amidotransferase A subunit family amidase